MRKKKAFIVLFAIISLSLVIHSFRKELQKEIEFGKELFGIPTYANSRFCTTMSSLRSDPYVAVFLTKDSYKDVIEFYKKSLKKGEFIYKELPYGARGKTVLTVYQFEMEKGILTNQISKGIEIVPYNTWNSRVYKANTKIKIILPAAEVKSAQKKMRQGNSGQRDEV